jgi:hypothetical protein
MDEVDKIHKSRWAPQNLLSTQSPSDFRDAVILIKESK